MLINTVTPSELGFVYEYDFRNKTVQNLTDDGWTNVSSATVNANGITFSSWTQIFNQPSGLQAKMANAERLVLTYTMGYSQSYNAVAGLTLINSDQSTGQTGGYINQASYEVLINQNTLVVSSHGSLSGDFTNTFDYDFVNKQCSISFPGVYTNTLSLTDAQISGTRNLTYIRCPINIMYLKTIKVTVEY